MVREVGSRSITRCSFRRVHAGKDPGIFYPHIDVSVPFHGLHADVTGSRPSYWFSINLPAKVFLDPLLDFSFIPLVSVTFHNSEISPAFLFTKT